MIELLKTQIADFHANGVPRGIVGRALDVPLDARQIVSVIGPRRAGKTWCLYSLIERLIPIVGVQNIVYVNFEDERLRLNSDSVGGVVDAYQQLYPDKPLRDVFFFFDEVQEVNGWEKFVRRLLDTVSTHIYITGSSARLLSREIATSLRGRTLAYTLLPLSFREYLRFSGLSHPDMESSKGRNQIQHYFDQFLSAGGYPATVGMDEPTRIKTLQAYFDVMLYRDVVERYDIRRPHLVKDFARRLLSANAQLFSVHKYYLDLRSRGVKVTKDALYDMVDHFADAFFVTGLCKYDRSVAKQAQALKKYYLNDTGLLAACITVPVENRGSVLESFVLLELQKHDRQLTFFSDIKECDFIVVDREKATLAIQVCHEITNDNRNRELGGLMAAMQRLGLKKGLILTHRQETILQTDAGSVQVLPAWRWSLALNEKR